MSGDMDERFYSLQCSVVRGFADHFRTGGGFFFGDDTEQDEFLDALANEENQ